jgi:hypothetical protein
MATRKKKTDVIISADIAEMTGPKVVKGNHLTVTTHPDGRTDLAWDDDALLAEVQAALASVGIKPKRKTKLKQDGNLDN